MQNLKSLLIRIDGQGYKAYKLLQGEFEYSDFQLLVDHVQGDPFAEPSRCRITLPLKSTGLSGHLSSNPTRRGSWE